jgi:hypothetical protein
LLCVPPGAHKNDRYVGRFFYRQILTLFPRVVAPTRLSSRNTWNDVLLMNIERFFSVGDIAKFQLYVKRKSIYHHRTVNLGANPCHNACGGAIESFSMFFARNLLAEQAFL